MVVVTFSDQDEEKGNMSSTLSPKLCELADFDPKDYHDIGALHGWSRLRRNRSQRLLKGGEAMQTNMAKHG
jgi:hypothetical protein